MRLYISGLIIALLCSTLSSCRKAQSSHEITGNYFIYGHAGGLTPTNYHTTYFLVNNGVLLKDVSQLGQASPSDLAAFRFTILCPQNQYNSVADLPESIPTELLQLNGTTIGNMLPDAGYTDMRARIDGITYKWIFEADLNDVSPPIREFYSRCHTSFR